jgi:AcrR family transcriptional regulator
LTGKRKRSVLTEHIPSERSRELLVQSAKRLFAWKGFEGATVREIADEAGVNIALVSYYFGGKEGLYRTCLDQFGKARLALAERLLQVPKSPEEFRVRLEMFAEAMLNSYIEEPELTRMIHRECEGEVSMVDDIFKETFLKVFETFETFLRSAQKQEIIKKELDCHLVTTLVYGMIVNVTRTDAIHKRYFHLTIRDGKYRNKLLRHLQEVLLEGIILGT